MLLARDKEIEGMVAVADTIKPSTREAIQALRKMKIEVVMITGDNKETAAAIASQLGIEKFFAEILPTEKSEIIKRLQQEEGRKVTGGLIHIKDGLRDVVAEIQLPRKTMMKIKENLFWAFAHSVALIPVAAGLLYILFGVLLNPILSGASMAISSVTVVTNSLSLRRFKPKL